MVFFCQKQNISLFTAMGTDFTCTYTPANSDPTLVKKKGKSIICFWSVPLLLIDAQQTHYYL